MTFNKTFLALSLSVLIAGCAASAPSTDTMNDGEASMMNDEMGETESSMTFVGGSSIVDHEGGFADFTVDLGNAADLENSTVTATVNLESVYTDIDRLTDHLKKEDFFDTANYEEATFTSTEITKDGDTYTIVGDLTIKGVTKSVIMTATLEDGVFTAQFDIPRKEFGIGNDSYGDKLLDEFVPVTAVVVLE